MNSIESETRLIEIAKRSNSNVLIIGPTGSGKTRLARQIHEGGVRRQRPFITVNLATLHEGTLESELFGHERGAYTGADQRRVGKFELAQGGTLFLDEIGELSPCLQARLLEFLQSRVICPVGSNREIKLDVRVIAATNQELEKAVERGRFREDLLHRLRVVQIPLRSLAQRAEEFDELVHRLLEEACLQAGRNVLRISEEVALRLEAHAWPGNIRELKNVLEYAAAASDGTEMTEADLPTWFIQNRQNQQNRQSGQPVPLSGALGVAELPLSLDYSASFARFEREFLVRALQSNQGRINQTARQTGMSKTTLIRRIRSYGLHC